MNAAASGGERLSNGTVSVCPSVCLSVPSIAGKWQSGIIDKQQPAT